jgi:hypothetical protein
MKRGLLVWFGYVGLFRSLMIQVHNTSERVSLSIEMQRRTIVKVNAQTNKDMPDRMAMKTSKVKAPWIDLFGKPVSVYLKKEAQELVMGIRSYRTFG